MNKGQFHAVRDRLDGIAEQLTRLAAAQERTNELLARKSTIAMYTDKDGYPVAPAVGDETGQVFHVTPTILDAIPDPADVDVQSVAEQIDRRLAGEFMNSSKVDTAQPLSPIKVEQDTEPWDGYDDLTVGEVLANLSSGSSFTDEEWAGVLAYEKAHKNRRGVIDALGSRGG